MTDAKKPAYGLLIETKESTAFDTTLVVTLRVVTINDKGQVRNPSDDPLTDFALRAYVAPKGEHISVDYAFYDLFAVEERDIRRMAPVFAKLRKGLERLNKKFGRIYGNGNGYSGYGFGDQVARIANVLGIENIVRQNTRQGSSYDDNEFSFFGIGDGVPVLNRVVTAWRTKQAPTERQEEQKEEARSFMADQLE
jgi:hypothetical protein